MQLRKSRDVKSLDQHCEVPRSAIKAEGSHLTYKCWKQCLPTLLCSKPKLLEVTRSRKVTVPEEPLRTCQVASFKQRLRCRRDLKKPLQHLSGNASRAPPHVTKNYNDSRGRLLVWRPLKPWQAFIKRVVSQVLGFLAASHSNHGKGRQGNRILRYVASRGSKYLRPAVQE